MAKRRRREQRTESDDSHARLAAVVDASADAIITIDERGIIDSCNHAAEKLFGYAASELIGGNVSQLMPEPYRAEHDGYLRNYCQTGEAKIIGIGREVSGVRKDGTTFPMHLSVTEVKYGKRRLFTGIVHDLSERRRLERHILESAGNEQRRIGRDLHDGLCQDLVGIAFEIENAARRIKPADDAKEAKPTQEMRRLAAMVRKAATDARDLAHGLNPVSLSAGGLPVALQALAEKASQMFGVPCAFHAEGIAKLNDDTAATHLYRIAQEAVGNAMRHGKPKSVHIELSANEGAPILTISDDGIGIPKEISDAIRRGVIAHEMASPTPQHPGIGLQTMQYRARVIGATLSVLPGPEGGTIIRCALDREVSGTKVTRRKRNRKAARNGGK